MKMKPSVIAVIVGVIGLVSPSLRAQTAGQHSQPVFTRAPWYPPAQAVSASGERLFLIQWTKEAALYSTESTGSPKGAGPNHRIRWYLVMHIFSKDPDVYTKQLESPIFEEPPTANVFPFPSEPIQLGNDPVDSSLDDGGNPMRMFTPDDNQNGGIQPRRSRGVLAYTAYRDQLQAGQQEHWFCIAPALWWGDGVTEAQVKAGCKGHVPKNDWGWNFGFVCDGSGATIPECVRSAARKKAAQQP